MVGKSKKEYIRFHTENNDEDVLVDVFDNGEKIHMMLLKVTNQEMMDRFLSHANNAARDLFDKFIKEERRKEKDIE